MPIITQPESNPHWGFLHGFGAGNALDSAQDQLRAIAQQHSDINAKITILKANTDQTGQNPIKPSDMPLIATQVLVAAQEFDAAVKDLKTTILDNVSYRGLLSNDLWDELNRKINYASAEAALYLQGAQNLSATGQLFAIVGNVGGQPPQITLNARYIMATVYGYFINMARTLDDLLYGQSDSLSGGPIYNLMPWTSENFARPVYKLFVRTKNTVSNILDALDDLLNMLTGLFKKVTNNLWWIIPVVVFGPAVINIIVAGRKGGANAALEETSRSIVAGREKTIEYGGKAVRGAAKLTAEVAGTAAKAAMAGRPRYSSRRKRHRR
jgi:hypothetical protein